MSYPTNPEQLRQYWREHINACREAGESGAAYCQRHQLSYHRFIYWRRKFADQDQTAQLPVANESGGFARVLSERGIPSSGLSLALPNGLVIQDINENTVDLVRPLLAVL